MQGMMTSATRLTGVFFFFLAYLLFYMHFPFSKGFTFSDAAFSKA